GRKGYKCGLTTGAAFCARPRLPIFWLEPTLWTARTVLIYPFQPRHNVRPTRSNVVKISARNQIKGKILEVKKGATTAHVRLEIGPGQVITSSITNEAVDELGLEAGGAATVVI